MSGSRRRTWGERGATPEPSAGQCAHDFAFVSAGLLRCVRCLEYRKVDAVPRLVRRSPFRDGEGPATRVRREARETIFPKQPASSTDPLVAATDGSAIRNPGPAGWAWVTSDGRQGSAGARHSTNNRMELRAVAELLEATDTKVSLVIQTDSQYVIDVFTKWLEKWRKRGMRTAANTPVENVDLIERIDRLLQGRSVQFEKVPGHAGHPRNEQAHTLANGAARRAKARLAREEA